MYVSGSHVLCKACAQVFEGASRAVSVQMNAIDVSVDSNTQVSLHMVSFVCELCLFFLSYIAHTMTQKDSPQSTHAQLDAQILNHQRLHNVIDSARHVCRGLCVCKYKYKCVEISTNKHEEFHVRDVRK